MNGSQTTYDGTLTYKLAGTIILALVTVFVLQASGLPVRRRRRRRGLA